MSSTTRIPKAEITGPFGYLLKRFSRKMLGEVPEGAAVMWLNGSPGIRLDVDGQVDTAVSLVIEDGRITRVYAIRNPHKLARLRGVAALTRT